MSNVVINKNNRRHGSKFNNGMAVAAVERCADVMHFRLFALSLVYCAIFAKKIAFESG